MDMHFFLCQDINGTSLMCLSFAACQVLESLTVKKMNTAIFIDDYQLWQRTQLLCNTAQLENLQSKSSFFSLSISFQIGNNNLSGSILIYGLQADPTVFSLLTVILMHKQRDRKSDTHCYVLVIFKEENKAPLERQNTDLLC